MSTNSVHPLPLSTVHATIPTCQERSAYWYNTGITLQKRRQTYLQEEEVIENIKEMVFSIHNGADSHLNSTAIMTTCTRPLEAPARQIPRIDMGR